MDLREGMLGGYTIVKVGGFGLVCVGSWADGASAGRWRTIVSEGLELGELGQGVWRTMRFGRAVGSLGTRGRRDNANDREKHTVR